MRGRTRSMTNEALGIGLGLLLGTTPLAAQPVAPAAPAAAPMVKIDGSETALQWRGPVTIAAFNLGFIFESVDSTRVTGGLIGAFGGPTRIKSALTGVTPAMMQAITDAAYADFQAQLSARGISIVAPDALFAAGKLKPMAVPQPINIQLEKKSTGRADYWKPSALPQLVMITGDFTGSGMSSFGNNIAASQNDFQLRQYAKSAGVAVIDVTYLVDFSEQKRPGAFSLGGLKANAGVSVVPGWSRMTMIGPDGRSASVVLRVGQAVEGELVDKSDATSGASKAAQTAANVAGTLANVFGGIGGLNFGKTRKYEFAARPDAYREGVTKATSLANRQMVAAIAR